MKSSQQCLYPACDQMKLREPIPALGCRQHWTLLPIALRRRLVEAWEALISYTPATNAAFRQARGDALQFWYDLSEQAAD